MMIEEVNNHWNTGKLEYLFGRGINISMTIKEIDSFYHHLKIILMFLDLEVHQYQVENQSYDDKEFLIQGPDGYLLRFINN